MQEIESNSIAEQVLVQENEYAFPYHYVTEFHDDRFRQHFVDTWGINYALTIEFMIDRVNKFGPSSVIDIGFGDGRWKASWIFTRLWPGLSVLMEVFEYIPLEEAVKFMKSGRGLGLLKPGAKLMLTVPHFRVDEITPFEKRGLSRRVLDKVLCNRWFVLNNSRLLRAIYRYHKSQLFYCKTENDCQRLFIEATAV